MYDTGAEIWVCFKSFPGNFNIQSELSKSNEMHPTLSEIVKEEEYFQG